MTKLKYPNTDIYPKVGDELRFDGEKYLVIVEDVIDTDERKAYLGG